MSTSEPGQWVGMIAFVRGVIAAFDLRQVDVARDEVAVDEDGFRPDLDDHVEDREEGLRRRDDFVARADAGQLQRDLDGGGRRRHGLDRPAAAKGGQSATRIDAPTARS